MMIRRWDRSGFLRALSEDESEPAAVDTHAEAPDETTEPDYAFEGYSVEFLDKVALLPVSEAGPFQGSGQ